MPFLSLSLINYRNLDNSAVDLSAKEVFFVGENGQGKSNLLEALYYSSYGSSFRTKSDSEIVSYGKNDFSIRSLYKGFDTTESVHVTYVGNKKKIEKNGKKIVDRKELINTIPCVLFCHSDMDFVTGEPERRRFFLDQSLSMYNIVYLDFYRRYRKVLKSRNLILKEHKFDMLDVYDENLIEYGFEIQQKRKKIVFQFNQMFGNLFKEVTGIEDVVITYEPSWKEVDGIITKDIIKNILQTKRPIDKTLETTMSGPHRDRIRFTKNGEPFIPTASTGQQRLASLLLRIVQAKFYTDVSGKKPVLLMDDVLLELDPLKRQKVTSLLPDYDQLFCTFLPGEPYEKYMKSTTKVYEIANGSWNELNRKTLNV